MNSFIASWMSSPPSQVYQTLRVINYYLASLTSLVTLSRIIRISLIWKFILKGRMNYSQIDIEKTMNKADIEKMILWIALFIVSITTLIASVVHKMMDSVAGIFVPFTTLYLLLICLALFVSIRVKLPLNIQLESVECSDDKGFRGKLRRMKQRLCRILFQVGYKR